MISVAGLPYTVRVCEPKLSSDLDGETLLSDCIITIRAGIPSHRQQQTFFHELMHVILDGEEIGGGRSKRDEEFVTRVSNTLYGILSANNLLQSGWWGKIVDYDDFGEEAFLPTPTSTTRQRKRKVYATVRPAGKGVFRPVQSKKLRRRSHRKSR